jgi:hypothetical protein
MLMIYVLGRLRGLYFCLFIFFSFALKQMWQKFPIKHCWLWRPKGQMSKYPIPQGEPYDSCILRRSCKSAFLHLENEV